MKIVIAPDSYKGSLTALEVASAIKKGINRVDDTIETHIVPMADGGEGTVQSLVDASAGEIVSLKVNDPLFRKIESFYGIMGNGKTAVIEMSAASGLPLLTINEQNPLIASTYGTGELIKDALDRGCRNFIIGLGGSATNDGGQGMAQALGVRFLNKKGEEIAFGGDALSELETIDISNIDQRIHASTFVAACDVDNPLCGPRGASFVYGPQKGANKNDVKTLDSNLEHFAQVIKNQLHTDILNVPGAGAAGGLGAGVMVFLKGKLKKGIDIVAKTINLEELLKDADLVITGEGSMDFQTAFGKAPSGVAKLAKKQNIPVIAIAGSLGHNYQSLYKQGFDGIFSIINKPMKLHEAIANAAALTEECAENIIRLWLAGR